MANTSSIKMDITKLISLEKQARLASKASVRIGVLGNDATVVYPGGTPIAEVAYRSEFGFTTTGRQAGGGIGDVFVAPRSFLRMPVGMFTSEIMGRVRNKFVPMVMKGQFLKWVTLLGISARVQVDQAFGSRGFGTWAPNTEWTIKQKGSDAPLIDTGKLRLAISSDVVVKP